MQHLPGGAVVKGAKMLTQHTKGESLTQSTTTLNQVRPATVPPALYDALLLRFATEAILCAPQ